MTNIFQSVGHESWYPTKTAIGLFFYRQSHRREYIKRTGRPTTNLKHIGVIQTGNI